MAKNLRKNFIVFFAVLVVLSFAKDKRFFSSKCIC